MVSSFLMMVPGVSRKRRCRVSGVAGGVAGEAFGQRCGEGLGEDDEGDVEVDVEVDGGGQGVGVERSDDLCEALFDGHPAGVALDELFRRGGVVVGDDDGGGFAAEAGDDELPDGAGVVGQVDAGGFVDFRFVVGAGPVQGDRCEVGGL